MSNYRQPVHHSDVIAQFCHIWGFQSYLELGVHTGETIEKIIPIVPSVTGVDLKDDVRLNPRAWGNFNFCHKMTNDFFSGLEAHIRFDAIFVDADHSYKSVYTDCLHSFRHLSSHGVLFLHDTDPNHPRLLDSGYCGDAYKIVEKLEEIGEFNVFTMPVAEAGLTVVQRRKSRRVLEFV
jgi:hypothetical protein